MCEIKGGAVLKKELFYEVYIDELGESVKLTYFLLSDNVSEEYCDLKVYGVEIDKEEIKKGARLVERKIEKELFFEKSEVIKFLQNISQKKVMPRGLKYVINDYIGKRVQLYNAEKV